MTTTVELSKTHHPHPAGIVEHAHAEGVQPKSWRQAIDMEALRSGEGVLAYGDRDYQGDSVHALQSRLLALGFYGPGATEDEIDGMFGARTRDALIAFQEAAGIEASGSLNAGVDRSLSRVWTAYSAERSAHWCSHDIRAFLEASALQPANAEQYDFPALKAGVLQNAAMARRSAGEPEGGGAAHTIAQTARTLGVARATNMRATAESAPRARTAGAPMRATADVIEAVRGADGVYRVVPGGRGPMRALPAGAAETSLVRAENSALQSATRSAGHGASRGVASSLARGLGRAAVPVALAFDAVDIGSSIAADKARGDGKMTETKAAAGRVGGGWTGALAGAAAGQALIPIPIVGALVGAAAGGLGGSWLGEKVSGLF